MSSLRPLPRDLAETDAEDNCCSFCGVSYLILHDVERLKARIAELEARGAELERAEAAARSAQANALQSMRALSDMDAARVERAEAAERELTQVRQERDSLAAKLENDHERHETLVQKLQSHLNALLEGFREMRAGSEALLGFLRVAATGSQIETAAHLVSRLSKDWEERLASLSRSRDQLELDLRASREELKDCRAREQELKSEVQRISGQFAQGEALRLSLQQQLEDQGKSLSDKDCKLGSLTAQLDSLQHQLSERESELAGALSRADRANGEVSALTTELSALRNDYSILQSSSNKQNLTLSAAKEESQRKSAQLLTELGDVRGKLEQAVQEIEAYKSAASSATAALEAEKSRSRSASEEKERMLGEINELKEELAARTQDLISREGRISSLTQELQAALGRADEAEARAQRSEKHALDLEGTISSLSSASAEACSLRREVSLLKSEVHTKDQELSRMRGETQTLETHVCNLDLRAQDLEHELENAKESLAAAEARAAKALEEHASCADKSTRLEALASENESLRAKLEALQATVANECQERTGLLRRITALRAQLADLRSADTGERSTPIRSAQAPSGRLSRAGADASTEELPPLASLPAIPSVRPGSRSSHVSKQPKR